MIRMLGRTTEVEMLELSCSFTKSRCLIQSRDKYGKDD